MKKRIALLCAAALLLGAAACGKTSAPGETTVPESETAAADETTAPQGEGLLLRVIDGGGTGMLTLAGETAGDVYTASADELTVYLDGQPSSADALANRRSSRGPPYLPKPPGKTRVTATCAGCTFPYWRTCGTTTRR